MPVRSEEITPGMILINSFSNPVTEPLLPDDIWHKFELDFLQLPGISEVLNVTPPSEDSSLESSPLPRLNDVWAGNHDCMWAGHCGSTEHSNDEFRHPSCLNPTPGTSLMRPPPVPVIKQENRLTSTQQQSLLKPQLRAALVQTPPLSDEEEIKGSKPLNVLMLLRDAIADCELDEEIDLCNYLEDRGEDDASMYAVKEEEEDTEEEDDVEEEEEEYEEVIEEDDEEEEVIVDVKPQVSNANIKSYQTAAESDHSYHKGGQNSSSHLAEFGIETPSDSEEEIDVVSVVDKMKVFLPTNPSNTDRQHIQRRMATAISRRNVTPGIKTILPQRKTVEKTVGTAASRRKAAEAPTRGVKRGRQNRTTQNTPYKRRSYGPSSDSEPEPSEKRSLHNNMERQRRIDLRNAFEDLRVLVPEVSKKERAAKVVILREATQYCHNLSAISKNYSTKMSDLNRKQEKLRCLVAQLRVDLAAKNLAAKR